MAANVVPLKQLFTKHFDFVPSSKLVKDLVKWRVLYENRDQHAEALNSPLLGVFRMKFLSKDSDALFDMLGANRTEMDQIIEQSSVNTKFIVASDAFNLLTVWAAYKFWNANLPKNLKEEACTTLFYMLQIKFFSSFVNHMLPHGARQPVMEATIDSLSDKFDIKKAGTNTWKLLMMARARELIDPSNIHFGILKTFTTDERVTYAITDTQTRIRTKTLLVIKEYHDTLKKGRAITESSITDDTLEGDKIIKELKNNYDSMITSVSNRVLNVNQFIKSDFIKIACSQSANAKEDMLRQLLIKFSTISTYQYQKHKQEDVDKQGNYKGYLILIRNLIQVTYRSCILDKVDLKSKLAILKAAVNLYSSSRIVDENVLKVKSSVDAMVTDSRISKRPATNVSLKISFIVYIILMTFDLD